MKTIIVEYHYQDGDVGVHPAVPGQPETRLWSGFSHGHSPSHILIREDSTEGQAISGALLKASLLESVMRKSPSAASLSGSELLALLAVGVVGFAREHSGSIHGLVEHGLVEQRHTFGGYFHLTDRGYDAVQEIGEAFLTAVSASGSAAR